MRTSEDICFLCLSRKATQTNSHILTKNAFNKLLGEKSKRKGFDIRINKSLVEKYKEDPNFKLDSSPKQDIPKESFLFCPECEHYMGIIEKDIVPLIKSYRIVSGFNEQIVDVNLVGNKRILIPRNISPYNFMLFIYTQFFRASVSSIIKNLKLKEEIEESIRVLLMENFCLKKNEFDVKIGAKGEYTFNFPFVVFTSSKFADSSENVIAFLGLKSPPIIFADEFMLYLFPVKNDIPTEHLNISNRDSMQTKIAVMHYSEWKNFQKQLLLSVLKVITK